MKYAITSGKTQAQLEAELSKEAGQDADYLPKERAFRSEKDVFEDYTQEERNQMFGVAPATVWENIKGYKNNPELVNTLAQGDAFAHDLMDSFIASILKRWKLVLADRIIPDIWIQCVKWFPFTQIAATALMTNGLQKLMTYVSISQKIAMIANPCSHVL